MKTFKKLLAVGLCVLLIMSVVIIPQTISATETQTSKYISLLDFSSATVNTKAKGIPQGLTGKYGMSDFKPRSWCFSNGFAGNQQVVEDNEGNRSWKIHFDAEIKANQGYLVNYGSNCVSVMFPIPPQYSKYVSGIKIDLINGADVEDRIWGDFGISDGTNLSAFSATAQTDFGIYGVEGRNENVVYEKSVTDLFVQTTDTIHQEHKNLSTKYTLGTEFTYVYFVVTRRSSDASADADAFVTVNDIGITLTGDVDELENVQNSVENLITDFETDLTGNAAATACDFAVSGEKALYKKNAKLYGKIGDINFNNKNVASSEGFSYWVYQTYETEASICAVIYSTVDSFTTRFVRAYTVPANKWTKVTVSFNNVNRQKSGDDWHEATADWNIAMTDEEVAGIQYVRFVQRKNVEVPVWIDDIYLFNSENPSTSSYKLNKTVTGKGAFELYNHESSLYKDTSVSFKAIPADGYKMHLSATDISGNIISISNSRVDASNLEDVYTFKMPNSNVNLNIDFYRADDYFITNFEENTTNTNVKEFDNAISGTHALYFRGKNYTSQRDVVINTNFNYVDAEGVSFWVYNPNISEQSIRVNAISSKNVVNGTQLRYFWSYKLAPEKWTKVLVNFKYTTKQTAVSGGNGKWSNDTNVKYNYSMTAEEIAGISNLEIVTTSKDYTEYYFEDFYLWNSTNFNGTVHNITTDIKGTGFINIYNLIYTSTNKTGYFDGTEIVFEVATEVESITVNDVNGESIAYKQGVAGAENLSNIYSFVLPSSNVTISVTYNSPITYTFGHTMQVKAVEPWGMYFNAYVYNDDVVVDYDTLSDYGMYIAPATDFEGVPTAEELAVAGKAFTKSNGKAEVKLDYAGDKYNITVTYDEALYTYELDKEYYAVFYVADKNGNVSYGEVKTRSFNGVIDEYQNNSDSYSATLIELCNKMDAMYEATTAYREGKTTYTRNTAEPETVADYTFGAAAEGSYKFGHTMQLASIEPWALIFNAAVRVDGAVIDYSACDDYGMIISDKAFTSVADVDASAYVYNKANGGATLKGDYISVDYLKGISTSEMGKEFYAMFYVVIDGQYYYGAVKTRSMMSVAQQYYNNSASYQTDVFTLLDAMVDLYDATVAHKAASVR